MYVFADSLPGAESVVPDWAQWIATATDSPVVAHTASGADLDSVFDVKVVYPGSFIDVDISMVPAVFLPRTGSFQLIDYEKLYAIDPAQDIRESRGIDPTGAIVVGAAGPVRCRDPAADSACGTHCILRRAISSPGAQAATGSASACAEQLS